MAGTAIRTQIPRGKPSQKAEQPAPRAPDISKDPPGLIFAPASIYQLQRGVDSLANAVRPTLGPNSRVVAMAQFYGTNRSPEILDDGATIVRRIVEIPDPYVNAGAMLLRHVLWSVHEQAGDGSVTAAVLMQALLREGVKLAAAGWNVMMMRHGIERGLESCLETIRGMARPVDSEAEVRGLALAASGDADLARRLGEMFDTLGPDGHIEVQEAYTPGLQHEYIEGAYWNSGWLSRTMANNALQSEAKLADPYVLLTRGRIDDWQEIAPIVNAVVAESGSLFVVALDLAEQVTNFLVSNKDKMPCAVVKAPGWGDYMENSMQDIAVLTGTRVIMNNMQESLKRVGLKDLGRARSVTVNRDYFGLIGGRGDPKALRERIALLRGQLKRQEKVESDETKKMRERLGKLVGGVGMIYVCEPTPAATLHRKDLVERTVNTVKRAELGGIVPGGGMAYVSCIPALRRLKLPPEQAVGVDALARALEEPLRAIARNSGKDDGPIAALALQQRPGWGYNASSDRFEDLWAAGVVDPLPVTETALKNAVSGALMALTTSVTVHRKNPPTSTEP